MTEKEEGAPAETGAPQDTLAEAPSVRANHPHAPPVYYPGFCVSTWGSGQEREEWRALPCRFR